MKRQCPSATSDHYGRSRGGPGALSTVSLHESPEAAAREGQAIERQFQLLENTPDIGRPLTEMPELRELVIAFGISGHVALYRHEKADDTVYVLAFRHQKQAGY